MATIAAFPDPGLTGIPYSRFYKPVPQTDAITYEQKFEDASIAVNAVTTTGVQLFELEFHGLAPHEADIWKDHYALAVHNLNSFPYTEKNGTTNTGVKYLKCEISHEAHRSWVKTVKITLVKYPS